MKKYIMIIALSMCAPLSAMNKSDNIIIHLAPSDVIYTGLKTANREDFAKKTNFHTLVANRKYSKKELSELSGHYVSGYYEKCGQQLPEQKITQERNYITQVLIFKSIAYAQQELAFGSIAYAQQKRFVHTAETLKQKKSKL